MTTTALTFRIATVEDAPQIQAMVQAAFRAEDSRENWVGDNALAAGFHISVDEITPRIVSPDGDILMAFAADGALVGSIEVLKRPADARLSMLAVDQSRHRGGIGRQVLAYAEAYSVKEFGVGKLSLNALNTRKELVAWYMRNGFVKTGEVTPFPVDRIPRVVLPKDLGFIEMEKVLEPASAAAGVE